MYHLMISVPIREFTFALSKIYSSSPWSCVLKDTVIKSSSVITANTPLAPPDNQRMLPRCLSALGEPETPQTNFQTTLDPSPPASERFLVGNEVKEIPLAPITVEKRADRGVLRHLQDDGNPEKTVVDFIVPRWIMWTHDGRTVETLPSKRLQWFLREGIEMVCDYRHTQTLLEGSERFVLEQLGAKGRLHDVGMARSNCAISQGVHFERPGICMRDNVDHL